MKKHTAVTRYFYIFFSLCQFLYACSSSKKIAHNGDQNKQAPVVWPSNVSADNNVGNVIDPNKAVKEKYAKCLKVPPDSIVNIKLYTFIDKWLNTPYKWGGTDKNGIDCSAFIQQLLKEVYNLKVPRSSIQQLYSERIELFRSPKYLSEGDILFFRMRNDKIVSHVGIYLHNYMFVNSSSSEGVSIASLKDIRWSLHFFAAGRVKVAVARN